MTPQKANGIALQAVCSLPRRLNSRDMKSLLLPPAPKYLLLFVHQSVAQNLPLSAIAGSGKALNAVVENISHATRLAFPARQSETQCAVIEIHAFGHDSRKYS